MESIYIFIDLLDLYVISPYIDTKSMKVKWIPLLIFSKSDSLVYLT